MKCRHCQNALGDTFLDLGFAPPSNAYLTKEKLTQCEVTFPLRLRHCSACWLVQTDDYVRPDLLFDPDYAYFSSASKTWLDHASAFAQMARARLELGAASFVVEIGSNDGYLLKNFVAAGIPCLGIEPTDSTADAAEAIGVPVLRTFFGAGTARELVAEGKNADLICGNNVYAHVPQINDFTLGLKTLLKPGGTIVLEFPHLMKLIDQVQFDTVYHEHFSYLSLLSAEKLFEGVGLRIFDVEELPTHGGSLRIYGCHESDPRTASPRVSALRDREVEFGLQDGAPYSGFQAKADKVKNDFLMFLLEQRSNGRQVAAYGAAAKGNTLLNYAGVKSDLLRFVCDVAPSKQGRFMPGSHIPILAPSALQEHKPDFIVILPWNIAAEVIGAHKAIVERWGGRFVVAVPELKVL